MEAGSSTVFREGTAIRLGGRDNQSYDERVCLLHKSGTCRAHVVNTPGEHAVGNSSFLYCWFDSNESSILEGLVLSLMLCSVIVLENTSLVRAVIVLPLGIAILKHC